MLDGRLLSAAALGAAVALVADRLVTRMVGGGDEGGCRVAVPVRTDIIRRGELFSTISLSKAKSCCHTSPDAQDGDEGSPCQRSGGARGKGLHFGTGRGH